MPTFFARRYVRRLEDVSRVERMVGIGVLLLAVAVVAGFVIDVSRRPATNVADRQPAMTEPVAANPINAPPKTGVAPPAPAAAAADVFPRITLVGWQVPEKVEQFTADNLHEKIDGAAERYIEHHFVGLLFGTYAFADASGQSAEQPVRGIDVYRYDMGAPENAAAMFQAEQPPDMKPLALAPQSYQVGGAIFFCRGRYYWQVLPVRGEEDAAAALQTAEALAR
jgi:hypothetical protein